VLITDLMMPLMSGEELIDLTLNLRPDVKPICLSAASSGVSLNRAVLFVPKPFSLRTIIEAVKEVLGAAIPLAKMTG